MKQLMKSNGQADIQEIKNKLDEAEAELTRVKALETNLGPDLGSDTFQKLEQSQANSLEKEVIASVEFRFQQLEVLIVELPLIHYDP